MLSIFAVDCVAVWLGSLVGWAGMDQHNLELRLNCVAAWCLTGGMIILQEGYFFRESFEGGGSILLTNLVKVGIEK